MGGDINFLTIEKNMGSGACWHKITEVLHLHVSHASLSQTVSFFYDFSVVYVIPTTVSGSAISECSPAFLWVFLIMKLKTIPFVYLNASKVPSMLGIQ